MKLLVSATFAALLVLPMTAFQTAPSPERDFLTRIRRLTVGRPAGRRRLLVAGRETDRVSERARGGQSVLSDLHSRSREPQRPKRVSPGIGKTTCAFFRPGTDEIEFASTHADPKSRQLQDEELAFRASGKERRYAWDYDPEMDIYAFNEKTGASKRLTTARGYDAEGSYSPDGQWLVFTSMRDAYIRELGH
jgi:hypothetical protein